MALAFWRLSVAINVLVNVCRRASSHSMCCLTVRSIPGPKSVYLRSQPATSGPNSNPLDTQLSLSHRRSEIVPPENAQVCQGILDGLPFRSMIRVSQKGLNTIEDSGFCCRYSLQELFTVKLHKRSSVLILPFGIKDFGKPFFAAILFVAEQDNSPVPLERFKLLKIASRSPGLLPKIHVHSYNNQDDGQNPVADF